MNDCKLKCLLEDTKPRRQVHAAVKSLVRLLGTKPSQSHSNLHYVELSIGYVAIHASVSYGTAWTAWHLVRGIVPWVTIPKQNVESHGFHVRVRQKGQKWGQHILISERQRRMCRAACGTDPDVIRIHKPEPWVNIKIIGKMARCPWHQDTHPSMLVNLDSNGVSGIGVCMACRRNGRRLVAHIRKVPGGWRARLAKNSVERKPVPRKQPHNQNNRDIDRILIMSDWDGVPNGPRGSLPTSTCSNDGKIGLGKLNHRGMRVNLTGSDLLSALKRADRKAKSESAWVDAMESAGRDGEPRELVPDSLISISNLSPHEWTKTHDGRSFPSKYRSKTQRWMLWDIDKLDDTMALVLDDQLETHIRFIAASDSWLSGRYAVVRTSPNGVQVWMELNETCDSWRLNKSAVVRTWGKGIGRGLQDVLQSIGAGRGIVDESAWSTNRFGRRPGWRMLSNGDLFLARLICHSDSK